MFDFDATGIDPNESKSNNLLKKGWYDFKIIEFVSKAGNEYPLEGYTKENNYPKVTIMCEVENPQDSTGKRVLHTVTFMPAKGKDGQPTPGAGMSVHFLKSIGQPFEGPFKVSSEKWVDKRFRGYVVIDEYKGKQNNKISQIEPIEDKKEAEIPF